jgi:hypothetical protein
MSTPYTFKWQLSPKDFLQTKLTQSEVVSLFSSELVELIYWRSVGLGADRIRSDSAELAAGLDMLIEAGILTPQRKTEILA